MRSYKENCYTVYPQLNIVSVKIEAKTMSCGDPDRENKENIPIC